MAVVAVSASPWYQTKPLSAIGPAAYGRIMAFHIGPPSGCGGGETPHSSKTVAGAHISSLVPPQLLLTRPRGTTLPRAASRSESDFPKCQQTAEKVAKRCECGVKSLAMVARLATCHGSQTVCRSRSGVADEVRWPTEKMRM